MEIIKVKMEISEIENRKWGEGGSIKPKLVSLKIAAKLTNF